MKRTNGIWYVKSQGVWFPAGAELHEAMKYSKRLLDKIAKMA